MQQRPRQNTLEKDIETFDRLRQRFSDVAQGFRAGFPEQGFIALDTLTDMYQVLLLSYHIKSTENGEDEAKAYLERITTLKSDIKDFMTKQEGNSNIISDGQNRCYLKVKGFKEIEAQFNELLFDFYKIKAEVGLT
jgi:hypothetical protein